jgi:hypothetical protein
MTTLQVIGLCLVAFGAAWIILGALMVAAKQADERLDEYDIPDWVNRRG